MNSSFSLSVLTEPIINIGPSNATIIYGDDVTLTCTVFSDENPNICWQTPESRCSPPTQLTMTSSNLYDCNLMISNVNSMDSGDYFFIVSNTNGSKMSTTARLSVIG